MIDEHMKVAVTVTVLIICPKIELIIMLPTSEPIVCNSLASLISSPTFRGGVAENWKKVKFFLNALLIMHFI